MLKEVYAPPSITEGDGVRIGEASQLNVPLFKATMEYHKTKDILHVMKILGHKNINNTLIYTQLVDFKDDEYVSKVANTPEEACSLVEAGFEYVCKVNDVHIFRKRK